MGEHLGSFITSCGKNGSLRGESGLDLGDREILLSLYIKFTPPIQSNGVLQEVGVFRRKTPQQCITWIIYTLLNKGRRTTIALSFSPAPSFKARIGPPSKIQTVDTPLTPIVISNMQNTSNW